MLVHVAHQNIWTVSFEILAKRLVLGMFFFCYEATVLTCQKYVYTLRVNRALTSLDNKLGFSWTSTLFLVKVTQFFDVYKL